MRFEGGVAGASAANCAAPPSHPMDSMHSVFSVQDSVQNALNGKARDKARKRSIFCFRGKNVVDFSLNQRISKLRAQKKVDFLLSR